jgi:16S rRNA (cytidine1402-2'-O)-methyltransferase
LPGKLYLCATPIGNLKDITVRVLDTLKEVDLIAAEDTRRTRKLITHYGIKKPLVSFHDQNEMKAMPKLLEELRRGKTIAQVSDAGMPGIADPGHRLVKACVEAGIDIEVLPGASALLTAAVLSAFPTDDIRFLGYLPKKTGPRHRLLEEVKDGPSTLVFYESPRRILDTLSDLNSILGDRDKRGAGFGSGRSQRPAKARPKRTPGRSRSRNSGRLIEKPGRKSGRRPSRRIPTVDLRGYTLSLRLLNTGSCLS